MITRILLVDDHPLFRAGILGILDQYDDIRVEGEASDGIQALRLVREIIPDLIIMDISMPRMDGIETTKKILEEYPHIKILGLSIHSGKRFVKQMLDAGAAGYLLKDSAPDELVTAIRKMAKGDMYLSSAITSIALSELTESSESEVPLLLNTKLYRPRISDDQIPRHKIIDLLEKNLNKSLTLVSAPAGYGKSIVISQWLESSSALHSWISIDDTFNDLNSFLAYFHAALDKISPGTWNKTESLIHASELPSLEDISSTLINELNQIQQPYIMVLDDYNLIHNMEIHRLIDEVLRFPPKYLQVCIITRRDPPLDLHSLRNHQGLNEIRMQELAFSEMEINQLVQRSHDIELSEEHKLLLQEKTEGWIVGIRLALYAMKSSEDATRILSRLKGNFHAISEFLLEEMLENQPLELQDLMLKTSMVDEFCMTLVEEVFMEQSERNSGMSSKEFFQLLVQSNLFVIHLDLENHWFRYHHLVKDFLSIQLEKRYEQKELASYHLLASKWYEANKMLDEAIHHAMAAMDREGAAEIVEKHRISILEAENWVGLKKWLNLLPKELKDSRSELLMAQVWVFFARLDFQNLFELLEKVQRLNPKQNMPLPIKGEISFFKGIFSYFSGQAKESLAYLQEAIKIIPDSSPQIRGEADLHLAMAMQMNGNKLAALEYLNHLLNRSISMKAIRSTKLWAGKAFVQLLEAQLQEALPSGQNIQRIGEKDKIIYSETWGIYIEAIVHFNRKNWVKAKTQLELLLSKLFMLHVNVAVDAFCMLAYILESNKKEDESKTIFKQLASYIEALNEPAFQCIASSAMARISLNKGDIDGAIQWAQLDGVNADAGLMLWWIETPRLTATRIFIAEGSPSFVTKALDKLESYNRENKTVLNAYQRIEILAQMAMCFFKLERMKEAHEALEESISLGEPGRWIWPFCHFGPPMNKMLEHLLDKNISPDYIRNILAQTTESNTPQENKNPFPKENALIPAPPISTRVEEVYLTIRETEIIKLLNEGLRNKEISEKLFVSESTIKKHLGNIFKKLDVKSRFQLLNKIKASGLINLN